jgi:hypothetical protein
MPGLTTVYSDAPFLDVSPMIGALRFQPSDFEYARGALVHVPSRHRFWFNHDGRLTIHADCGCSGRSVRPDQSRELFEAFTEWRSEYWRPLRSSRSFAPHFASRDGWAWLFRDLGTALGRFLGKAAPAEPVSTGPSRGSAAA